MNVSGREQFVPLVDVRQPVFSGNDLKKLQKELPQKETRREIGGKMLPYIAPGLLGMSLASLTYSVLIGQKKSLLFFSQISYNYFYENFILRRTYFRT